MNSDQYIWLLWSSAFLIPWALVYWHFPAQQKAMFCGLVHCQPLPKGADSVLIYLPCHLA